MDRVEWSITAVFFALIFSAGLVFINGATGEIYETETRADIWDAQCPYGYYWTDTDGAGNLIGFRIDSELRETYIIKYLEGDELKTVMYDSSDKGCRIHLTDDNSSMYIAWVKKIHQGTFWSYLDDTEVHIYLPDPRLFPEEG